MNPFDIVICALAATAIIFGYRSGLLRSVATILGYAVAAPIAVTMTPPVTAAFAGNTGTETTWNLTIFFAIFLICGILVGLAFRKAVDEAVGPTPSLPDRLTGSILGAVRIGLVAITIVLVFDRLIPAKQEPAFLKGSYLRPILSAAAKTGLKSLPPETVAYIDRLKRAPRA